MASFSWEHLTQYHCQYLDIVLSRKKEIACQYEIDKHNGTCSANLEKIKEFLKTNSFLIWTNSYPYDVELNVRHYVFWFSQNYTMEDAVEIAKVHFKTDNIVIMCNIQSLKSVLDIEHYHLFVLDV